MITFSTTDYSEEKVTPEKDSERAAVKAWQEKITAAKKKWQPEFDRMRSNMDFVAGLQWASQKGTVSDRYVANFVLRLVEQKVSTLYAKNPTFEAVRRPRMLYSIWDENDEAIQAALLAMTTATAAGIPAAPEVAALLADYEAGKKEAELYDRIAKTLNVVFAQQIDRQEPAFKTQLKALVRRAVTCGVGYTRVNFCSETSPLNLQTSVTRSASDERAKMAMELVKKMAQGEVEQDGKEIEELRQLLNSLQGPQPEQTQTREWLEFDFPPATSIIVDKSCRSLVGFVGARWIAQEFILARDYVNSFYEVEIKASSDAVLVNEDGQELEQTDEGRDKACVRLWEVFDLDTRSTFVICEGHKEYVSAPGPVEPATRSFWPIFSLVFNAVETEHGCRASVYPISDVQLAEPAQKEWNRAREEWRKHRKANRIRYVGRKGLLQEQDKDAIRDAEQSEFIELEIPPDAEPGKILQPLQLAQIDPAIYDTRALMEDVLLTTGTQEANIGPAQPGVTATVGSIAEQSRMTVSSSNVDALDEHLTAVAECAAEKLLLGMSLQTVFEIAGRGAVWAQLEREQAVKEITLQVKAASSGRPNKALEVSNAQQLAPLLLQAGANPKALVRELARRLDENVDIDSFFPLVGAQMPSGVSVQPTMAGTVPPNPQNV